MKPPARPKLVCLCTPSLGTVSLWWARAISAILWPQNIGKYVHFTQDVKGDEIAETRNRIVSDVLALEEKHYVEIDSVFWVDDDVIVAAGALLQLYAHQRDIVSGVYFTKGEPSNPLIYPERLAGVSTFVPDTAMDVWGHGMGLCLVKAGVYRKMAKRCPKDKYGRPQWYKTNREMKLVGGMLDCGGTEDLHFLDRAGKLGYQPMVDCSKHAFGWHYDLKTGQGYPKRQWNQWAKNQSVTWQTPEGRVVWK